MADRSTIRGRRSVLTAVAALTVALAVGPAQNAAMAFDANKEVILPSTGRHFKNINPAIKMAPAWGNRGVGQHGTFGQFPPKFVTPFHTHSGAYHGIVVKGEMTNPFAGETNAKKMGPGSYWYVPAGAVHATACVSSTPCEFYFHAGSKFDFVPVKK